MELTRRSRLVVACAIAAVLAVLLAIVTSVNATAARGEKPCKGNGARACPTATPTPTPTTTSPSPSPTVTASPSPSPSPTSTTCTVRWTSSDPFGSWADGGYLVNNNEWSGDHGPQTISACSWHQWSVVSNQPGAGADDGVKTYPDTQRHVSYPLSSLTSMPSTFDVTVPPGAGTVPDPANPGKQWNAAYDLWLDNFGTEVMIWNTWTMNWRYWYGVYGGEQVTIDGVVYYAYTNGAGLWFIRQTPVDVGSVDIAHVLQWAVSRGWLRSSQVLGEVEYGFEVAYTGEPTTFTLNDYTLTLP